MNMNFIELSQEESIDLNGGCSSICGRKYYNHIAALLFFPFYDAGYYLAQM
jgi:hypothetical protein